MSTQDDTALAVIRREETGIESVSALHERMAFEAERIAAMKQFVGAHMKKDLDYGVIPGTGTKPTLLKPGAEVMCGIYRYEPEYEIAEAYEPERVKNWTRNAKKWNGTRMVKIFEGGQPVMETGTARGRYEVRATCTLRHITTGHVVGQGVGSCNSWEAKYLTVDLDDAKNTVLKMAQKRAYVAATLSACRLSAFFTQDLEDSVREEPEPPVHDATVASDIPHPAASEPGASDGPPVDEGVIEKVIRADGTGKSGKAWRRFDAYMGDHRYTTFSVTIGAKLEAWSRDKARVRVIYKQTEKGRDIEEVQVIS